MLLKDSALLLKAVSRRLATVRKLSQALELILVLLLVDIHIYICLLGHLKCIFHLESMAASHCKACDELIDVSGSVWRAHLHSLLL